MYNLEWEDVNKNIKYPFYRVSGDLPNSVFTDCLLQISGNHLQEFKMTKYSWDGTRLSVEISDESSVLALQGTSQNGSTLFLSGVGEYLGSEGRFKIYSTDDLPYGEYSLEEWIEPCRVVRLGRGVSSINGITHGNVSLIPGQNVSISVEGTTIKVDTNDGLCACDKVPCIKTINGVSPNTKGDIFLIGLGCVEVSPISNGLQVANTCEESCCGCEEVNEFIDLLKGLDSRIRALESS